MKKLVFKIATLVIVAGIALGCQNVSNECIVETIEQSEELQDYLIACMDLDESFIAFSEDLRSLDTSLIRKTIGYKGEVVLYLPTNTHIETYVKSYNETKKRLRKKFPQIKRLKEEEKLNCIESCINDNITLKEKIERYHTYRLLTKSTTYTFNTETDAFSYLENQIASPNYVEVILISYTDGVYKAHISDGATSTSCSINMSHNQNGWYTTDFYSDVTVSYLAHTHRYSSRPSRSDENFKESHPGLTLYIYTTYDGLVEF
ncbi:MAG: hypothetical protein IJ154_07140 [Bacteroidales bacterium]|nr:hypothetical protein [Bacteroidales bacterium]